MDRSLTPATPAERPARVVLGDADAMLRTSLRRLLEAPPSVIAEVYGVDINRGFEVVGDAATGSDLMSVVQATQPDVVLLDLRLPSPPGLETLPQLRAEANAPRLVVLTGDVSRAELIEAIRLGVRALILKSATPAVVFEALRWVLEGRCWLDYALLGDFIDTARPLIESSRTGGTWLTRREREVLAFVVAGYANKDIARAAAVTEDSIKHHLTRMFNKLGVANRVELAMLATERGLLDPPAAPQAIRKPVAGFPS
jgi:two-component system, NarL family, nitrate/nitrite response regulator NarL